jgi:hypothetical protein
MQGGDYGKSCVDAQGLRQGPFTTIRTDGSVSLRGAYQNGQYHGTFRAYDPQGHELETYELVEGTGTFTIWHARSKPSLRQTYRAGLQHGVRTHWHANGQKRQELSYVEGRKHGSMISWATDGTKTFQSEYDDGRLHGVQKSWQNGELQEESEYFYGRRIRQTRYDSVVGGDGLRGAVTERWGLPTYEGEATPKPLSADRRRWQACTAHHQCVTKSTTCCACDPHDYVAVHYRFEEQARAALAPDCQDTRCDSMLCQPVGGRCDEGYCVMYQGQ